VWKRLGAPGSWWFLLNRYIAFVGSIFVRQFSSETQPALTSVRQISIFNFTGLSVEGCRRYSAFRQILMVLTVVIVSCQ
jgi:hypothetical protein